MSEADTPKPLVSIVIPCYNHAEYVHECIKSIIEQDYENIELIIIDDGSKDESVTKIKELVPECKKRFVRFEFRVRPNKGLCATLNEAIFWCEGQFYSVIASDDMMLPIKTSTQIRYFLDHPECDALFGGMYIVDDRGAVLRESKGCRGCVNFEDLFLMRKALAAPTQMIRLEKLRAAGPYPEGLYIEDWYMWLRMSHADSVICTLDETLVYYRRHENNMSSRCKNISQARKTIIEAYSTHPLYAKAEADCLLYDAVNYRELGLRKRLVLILKAFKRNPVFLFERHVLNYVFKIVHAQVSKLTNH